MNPHFRISEVRAGHSRGWSYTPLVGKRPKLREWPSLPREPLYLALKWARLGNVGLRTGRNSGIVVIDVDPGGDVSALDLPATVEAVTGRGGRHLYYHTDRPVRNSCGKLGPHIDVRADGGQVVFVGSRHPATGIVYTWAVGKSPAEIKLAELPQHIG